MKITKQNRIALLLAISTLLIGTIACTETSIEREHTLSSMYPQLSNTPLANAKIVDLPEHIILQTDDFSITRDDIEQQIETVPEENRHILRNNTLFIIEQLITENIIISVARSELSETRDDIDQLEDRQVINEFFTEMTSQIDMTDAEIADFYEENIALMGEMSLEEATPQITNFLMQQKQQEIVENFSVKAVDDANIEVSQEWVAQDVAVIMDNPADNARVSGNPSLVVFDSQDSPSSQEIISMIETLENNYGGQAEFAYLSVNEMPLLASRYEVMQVPTMIFYDDTGQEYERFNQAMSYEDVEQHIQALMD